MNAYEAMGDGGADRMDITRLNAALESADDLVERVKIIRSAVQGLVTFSSSLSLEDQAVLHGIVQSQADIDVFTLDTGRHFPETLDVIAASNARYDINIRVVYPEAAKVESLVARDGVNGFRNSIEARKACCDVRKVQPLRRQLSAAKGWMTGLRREQSQGRAETPFASWDDEFGLAKFNPIADWTLDQLEAYVESNRIPVNALHKNGFPSIGCQPCTRAIEPWEDIRAGRWWWENQDGKECGLHNRPTKQKTSIGQDAS